MLPRLLGLLGVAWGSTTAARAPDQGTRDGHGAAPPPHIIHIVADDLGWSYVDWHRDPRTADPPGVPLTPRLDALRKVGPRQLRTAPGDRCRSIAASLRGMLRSRGVRFLKNRGKVR